MNTTTPPLMDPETLASFHSFAAVYGTKPEVLAADGNFYLTTAVIPNFGDLSIVAYYPDHPRGNRWGSATNHFGMKWGRTCVYGIPPETLAHFQKLAYLLAP